MCDIVLLVPSNYHEYLIALVTHPSVHILNIIQMVGVVSCALKSISPNVTNM